MAYIARTYRKRTQGKGMISFPVRLKESDLLISVDKESFQRDLETEALSLLAGLRRDLEQYIWHDPEFQTTLIPHHLLPGAPRIVRMMAAAARRSGVGPMAAVAGAVAEMVGRGLLRFTKEVIVENGGDIYMKTCHTRKVAIFAGNSPFSEKIGLKLAPHTGGYGICTSSATVGPSLSFGSTDAAVVVSASAALADAAASSLGNLIHCEEDFAPALKKTCKIKGVQGAVVILGDKLGVQGDIELVSV